MAAVGGDVIEITYNHPTIGSGVIFCKSGEDSTISLGGFRSNDEASSIAGNGEVIDIMTNERWSVSVTASWDMNTRKDLENQSAIAGSPIPADYTITWINGITYGGTGKPVGDLSGNGAKATFPLKLSGGGKLTQI